MADRFSMGGGSEAVDTRRYLAAVRRDLPLIAAIAIGLTVFAVVLSTVLPKTYSATATVGFDLSQASAGDSAAQERNINTQVALVTQTVVLEGASQRLARDPGIQVDQDALRAAINAEGRFGANLLDIHAESDDPRRAAAYANAIASEYIANKAGNEDSAIKSQISRLERSIQEARTDETRESLRSQQDELYAQLATQVERATFASAAVVPGGPDSPKPVRNGVLSLFVGLFLGILIALLRDQLRPRFTNQRDLAQFLELPVVATVPELGRRLGVRTAPAAMRVEQEAYQSLSAALRLALPPGQTHVLMLTSSMHAEGKTTVATRVARLLASSGHRTLLISGDLRWPRLDALLHVEGRQGLSDLLAAEQSGGAPLERITSAIVQGTGRDRTTGGADILPSGTLSSDAARLLSSGSLDPLMAKIRGLGYTYVIVDSTPLLGLADAKLIARSCDRVLVVSRLERIAVPAAMDLRDELARVGVPLMGLVVIGGVTEASPYYSGVKFVPPAAGSQPQGTPSRQLEG